MTFHGSHFKDTLHHSLLFGLPLCSSWQQEYGNSEGPFMIGTEEAITPRLTLIGYIEERSLKFPYQDIDRRVRTMGYNWEGQREWPLRYMLDTRQA